MALLNVRLDAEDARLVADLRAAGVAFSSIVRDAIRAASARYCRQATRIRPSEILAAIHRDLPDPPDLERSGKKKAMSRRELQRRVRSRLLRKA
jgi:hypothetical protein